MSANSLLTDIVAETHSFSPADWSRYLAWYAKIDPPCQTAMFELALRFLGRNVLDAGMGPGKLLKQIIDSPHTADISWYVGIDRNMPSLKYAKENLAPLAESHFRTGFILRDLEGEMPFAEDTFDSVASLNVLYSLSDPKLSLERLAFVLSPGGRLILTGPTPEYIEVVQILDAETREHYIHRLDKRSADYDPEFEQGYNWFVDQQKILGSQGTSYLLKEDEIVSLAASVSNLKLLTSGSRMSLLDDLPFYHEGIYFVVLNKV